MPPNIIPTVYSFVFPETKRLFEELRQRDGLAEMYEQAWTKRQDPMHVALLETWQQWTRQAVTVDWDQFQNSYVCAGSAEAIRASVATQVATQRHNGQTPCIHIFEGEYEGYRAYAEAFFCEVVVHDRDNYRETLSQASAGERFYVSAPSSIDGNVWTGFDDFVTFVGTLKDVSLAVDLCYVGATANCAHEFDLRSPVIDTIFFSLSKVFGVYYHRIGGVFSRVPIPALVGNRWFKNLLSIRYGTELMQRFSLGTYGETYAPMQQAIVADAQHLGKLVTSDVILLAHETGSFADGDDRYRRTANIRRFCLTPELDHRSNQ